VTEPGLDPADDRPSRYARPRPQATPAAQPELSSEPAVEPVARPRSTRPSLATLARYAGPPAVISALATVVLIATAVALRNLPGLAVNAWLLTVGGLTVWTCWRILAAAVPTSAASAFDTLADRPPDVPSVLPDVQAIVAVIIDAEWGWRGVEYGLRPLLRTIAAARLIELHQIDMETEPAAAERLLGAELWALVAPGAYGPAEAAAAEAAEAEARAAGPEAGAAHRPATPDPPRRKQARGIPRATIKRAVDRLEAL
jgi:hypothetical protein